MWNHNPYDGRTGNKVEFEIYITAILFSRYISFLFHIQIDVFTFEVPVRQLFSPVTAVGNYIAHMINLATKIDT